MPAISVITPFLVRESSITILRDTRLSAPQVTRSVGFNNPGTGDNKKVGLTNPIWRDIVRGFRSSANVDVSTAYARSITECSKVANCHIEASTFSRYMPSYRVDLTSTYNIMGNMGPFPRSDTETRERALAKIKKELKSRIGNADLMAPTAEIRELRGLIHQAMNLTGDFLLAVINARKTRGKSAWKFLTNAWLGYNFGLAPLVADIGSAANAIDAYLGRKDINSRLAASASKSGMFSYSPNISQAAPYGCVWDDAKGEGFYRLSYRFVGGFRVDISSGNDYSLLEHLGFGLSQIPATLWELTAFSWMFDYFSNVGSYLDDIFSSPPGTTRYLVENRRLEVTCQNTFGLKIPSANPNGLYLISNNYDTSHLHYVDFQRTPLTQLPHAGLYIKSFDAIGSHGVSKLLNLISVASK